MNKVMGIFLLVFSLNAMSVEWDIGKSISVSPSDDLDVTFEIVEEFDPREKVLLGWKGNAVSFFMMADEQPGGQRPKKYWRSIINELKKESDNKKIKIMRETKNRSGVEFKTVKYLLGGEEHIQLIGVVTGKKKAYYLLASSADGDIRYMQNVVSSLLNTVKISE